MKKEKTKRKEDREEKEDDEEDSSWTGVGDVLSKLLAVSLAKHKVKLPQTLSIFFSLVF